MNLKVNASPHIRCNDSTQRMMLDVLIALLPALLAGIFRFGIRALIVTLVCVVSSVFGELLCGLISRKRLTVQDLSCIVTGALLSLLLPVGIPYPVAALGAFFASAAVKGLPGGLGENTFDPALAGRALLMLLFPAYMIRFSAPGTVVPLDALFASEFEIAETPLQALQASRLPDVSIQDLLFGNTAGCIGTVSALAVLSGGIFLLLRKVIRFRIPLSYLGTVSVLTLVFYRGDHPLLWMLYNLLSGGVLLCAFFLAPDPVTSPTDRKAQWIYGAGCGILTVLFRYYSIFPDGVTYAVLLMNAMSWVLDRWCSNRETSDKSELKDLSGVWKPVLLTALASGVLLGAVFGLSQVKAQREEAYLNRIFGYMVPGSTSFEEIPGESADEGIRKVYRGETGYVVEVTARGYVDDMTLLVGVLSDGCISGITVKDSNETFGLGGRASSDVDFLAQFLGAQEETSVDGNADALTGATETGRAVSHAVDLAAEYVRSLDVSGRQEGR